MTSATHTLLYIDDDKTLARLVDRGLTRAGFSVVHAASGQQGLDRLAQGGIDVIALDQYMPGLDGLDTLEQILKIPDAPPVVFVTAATTFTVSSIWNRGTRLATSNNSLGSVTSMSSVSLR